jgi:hypothetical protein
MIDSLEISKTFRAFPALFFNRKVVLNNELRVMCVLLVLRMPAFFLTTVVTININNIGKQLIKTAKEVHNYEN